MNWKQFLPIADWLSGYPAQYLKGDLAAGLTVGVMLIPQGMAYAMIAGLPPIYGLYASTLPLLIYALLGTSRQLAVGPVAMVSLLTAAGVGTLAAGGTEAYIGLAIVLALLVGAIQLLVGVLRLGFLVNFLSHPVISGFTSAAALIIGLSQLKHLLGVELARSHHVHEIIGQAIGQFGAIHWITFGIGLTGILLIKGAKRIHPAIPGPLLVVLFGILAVWGLGLHEQGVNIVGTVPEGLPAFRLPAFSGETARALLPVAAAIALVSFMESIAVAKAVQATHKDYKVVPNQELIALGLANIGGAFFQSYPVTGGFSRTAVNDQAGAKTGLAAIVSALLIVLTLLFLTPLFYYLPKAVLASVIMVAVFGLIDYKEAFHLWKTDRVDFWLLLLTFVGTLTLGIELGIGLGVLVSLIMVIYRSARPHLAILGKVPGTEQYRNLSRFEQLGTRPELLIVRFDAPLHFANLSFFRERIDHWVTQKGPTLEAVILHAGGISGVDSSALRMLEDLIADLRASGIAFYLSAPTGPVRDTLARAGLMDTIGKDKIVLNVQRAVERHEGAPQGGTPALRNYALQAG